MREISICIILSLVLTISAWGQENPVSWTINAEVAEKVITLTYEATIDDGWYVYSQYLESDLGPIATSINLDDESIKSMEKIEEIGKKKEGYDKLFEMNIVKFANKLKLVQKIERTADLKNVKGYIEFMTCDDSRCLPPTQVDFNVAIN